MEEYERQNGPLPGNEKVSEWLRNVKTAYSSERQAPASPLNPTLPAAQPKDQNV
jgi:hypothetical protein